MNLPMRTMFQDEGRFGRINDPRRCWAPKGVRPIIRTQVVREYIYGFAAVSPADGKMTTLVLPWADAETMSLFLAEVAKEFPSEFILMFMDGASWHKAKGLRVPERMALEFVPPYSPECNPAEHIWEDLRENHFGNDAMESIDEVDARLSDGFRLLHAEPERVKSMTCFSWMKECLLS
jgi:transposase